jgi:hypothetical protein
MLTAAVAVPVFALEAVAWGAATEKILAPN